MQIIVNRYHAAYLMYWEYEDPDCTYNIYLTWYYKFHEKPEDCGNYCQYYDVRANAGPFMNYQDFTTYMQATLNNETIEDYN